jgi:hypothetical protein
MIDSFPDITIFDSIKAYNKFEKDHADDIINFVELDGKIMVTHRSEEKDVDTMLDNSSQTHNVNIAIASAITAYARINMTQFKII